MQGITKQKVVKSAILEFAKKQGDARGDGWQNNLTGMNITGIDKTASTRYSAGLLLSRQEIEEIYECEGLASSIIDNYVREMHREGFTITADKDDYLKDELKRLKFSKKSREGVTWSFVHGGGLMVFILADGSQKLEEPLNKKNITSLDAIQVFDRYEATVAEWDTDPESPTLNEAKIFQISTTQGTSFRVHASRTSRIDGGLLPNRRRHINHGWGQSLIQKIHTQLKQLGGALQGVENIIDDFITGVLKIKNLADLLQADTEGENLVQKRIQLLDTGKHIINTMIIDVEEEYAKNASAVGGLDNLLDKFILMVAAVSGEPVSVFTGQAPSGLNSTGDSEIRMWYDRVKYEQTNRIDPTLSRILELLMLVKGSPFGGSIDNGVVVEFTPLWQPTDKELAETEKIRSETSLNYINSQQLLPDEGRKDLDTRTVYEIDPNATIEPEDDDTNTGNTGNAGEDK